MELMYLCVEDFSNIIAVIAVAFGGGFMVTVTLHYIGYAIFGLFGLLNMKK